MVRLKSIESQLAFTLIIGIFFMIANLYMRDIYYTQITYKHSIYQFFDNDNFSTASEVETRNECHLAKVDPWDPQVIPYLNPDWNPRNTCRITRKMHTELKNNTIRMLNETTSQCRYRCLYLDSEVEVKADEWIKMEKNATYHEICDFIETHCMENDKTVFRYIHDQVVKPKDKIFQKEDDLHPSVFMLIIDSTSSSSASRSIMETNEVLRQFYDATTFYYHNKIGLNSRPNAFGIFSGTRISKLDERRFLDRAQSEYPRSCRDGVVRNNTVIYDFVDQNYASMLAEDWISAFSWPICKGYGKPPTDHICNALVLRSTRKTSKKKLSISDEKDFENYFYKGECQEPYQKLISFTNKFLDEYRGISKFAMIWLSLMTHDSPNGLYHTDKYFADFFRNHINNLNNSFLFVMGDHGLRYSDIRNTPVGLIEDNNPFLMVALPKYLRSNEQLLLNLKQNSRRHTSQFDLYATLYDIARYARNDNFQKWDEHDFRNEFGKIRGSIRAKSLLRPILYDRTCDEMEIPQEYCICEKTWHKIDIYGDDATKAALEIISHINNFLDEKNLIGTCRMLDFTQVISAEYLEGKSIYKIVINASPSNGKYEAQLLKERDNFKVITEITRLDKYGNQGHCAPAEDVRPLCYCQEQQAAV